MTEERCEKCRFCQTGMRKDGYGNESQYWFCRRYPPTLLQAAPREASFPYVNGPVMWCGEYRPLTEA